MGVNERSSEFISAGKGVLEVGEGVCEGAVTLVGGHAVLNGKEGVGDDEGEATVGGGFG